MRSINIYFISIIFNNSYTSSIDFWLTIISIFIALIAIIISTYYAAKSIRQGKKDVFQKKKETLFDLFNNFLLFLETIANAKSYGITKFNPKDSEIDFLCLDSIGKIHCFSQKNNLFLKNHEELNNYINKMLTLSNNLQDIRKIKNEEIQKSEYKDFDNKIKCLRKDILKIISNPKFFKEENK